MHKIQPSAYQLIASCITIFLLEKKNCKLLLITLEPEDDRHIVGQNMWWHQQGKVGVFITRR